MEAICEKREDYWTVGGPEAGQPENLPIEIVRGPHGAMWAAFKPSWSDLWRLVCGRPIRIGILGSGWPPIYVTVDELDEVGKDA